MARESCCHDRNEHVKDYDLRHESLANKEDPRQGILCPDQHRRVIAFIEPPDTTFMEFSKKQEVLVGETSPE